MSTFKTNKEPMEFDESNEFFTEFLSVFSTMLGKVLSKPQYRHSNNSNSSILTLVQSDQMFHTEFSYMVRFAITLLEHGELDISSITQDEMYAIANRELPSVFTDKVMLHVGSVKVKDLVGQVSQLESEANDFKDERLRLLMLVSLGAILYKIKGISNEMILDTLLEDKEFTSLTIEMFKRAKNYTAQVDAGTSEIDLLFDAENLVMDINETPFDQNEYNRVMFDISSFTKEKIVQVFLKHNTMIK